MRDVLTASILAICAAIALPGAAAAAPQQPLRVVVSCDTAGTDLLDRVCPILIESLNETAAGTAQYVPEEPAAVAALYLRLETSLVGSHLLKGRLIWRKAPDDAETAGPAVTLRGFDSELTEDAIGNFARALAKVSELPIAE